MPLVMLQVSSGDHRCAPSFLLVLAGGALGPGRPRFGGWGGARPQDCPPHLWSSRGLLSETSCSLNLPGFQRAYVSHTPVFTMLNVELDVEKH